MRINATLAYVRGEFIFQKPKTERSRRTIKLAPPVVEILQRHQARQREWIMRHRHVWDGTENLFFPNGVGHPREASQFLQRDFYPLIESAGLPKIHFHDLRHAFVHLLTTKGVGTNEISGAVGHADEATTLRFYGRLVASYQERIMRAIEEVLNDTEDQEATDEEENGNEPADSNQA